MLMPAETLSIEEPQSIVVDDDSDYGESLASTATQSMRSSINDYVYENGRRYHRYSEGSYILPNDETEQDRLDVHHHIFLLLLKGRLFCAPIESPELVLDLGTGTGIWALDFAETYPSAQVIGTDLSPIQPSWLWANCRFEVDDMEQDWVWPFAFDFIHARNIAQSIRDWPTLTQQMYKFTRPGGYVELSEVDGQISSDDDSIPADCNVRRHFNLFRDGLASMGIPLVNDTFLKGCLEAAGFRDVKVKTFKQPSSFWPKDKALKEAGRLVQAMAETGLEAYTLALLTRVHKMSHDDAIAMARGALADFRNRKLHIYQKVWHVYGRKPEA